MFSFVKPSHKSSPARRKSSGGRFRPNFEQLEERQLLSASAVSNFGGIVAQFQLNNQQLVETVGRTHTTLNNVQGLFQGKDSAGRQVAYDWTGGNLNEFTGSQWAKVGAADAVAQDGNGGVYFTQRGTLELATGVPTSGAVGALPLLSNVQGLMTSGGQASLQIGAYFKVNVTAQVQPSGAATLTFSQVQMNIGRFAASFLNSAIANLQAFTRPLQPLADALDKPLIPGWGITTAWVMQQLGYDQAASDARTFAGAIRTINNLQASLSSSDAWVNLGSFTAQVKGPAQLVTLRSVPNAGASITSQLNGSIAAALSQLQSIPGLKVVLNDPQQLMKLVTGENTTLFSYTLSVPHAISVTKQQQLAAIPVSPATLTELDVLANLGVNVSGTATFGFDSSGFQSGNLANGFFIQNARLRASLTVGLSGLLNEADLAGYQMTGAVTGTITASLRGADGSGKLYPAQNQNGGIVITSPNWRFGITTKALGPQQMLSLAIQQYGPYLKKLVGFDAEIAANILNGKGVSATQIAQVLGTLYGIPPDKTASILQNAGVKVNEIVTALKNIFGNRVNVSVGPNGVHASFAGASASVGSQGVSVSVPGASGSVGSSGVSVSVPGASGSVGSHGVSASVPGASGSVTSSGISASVPGASASVTTSTISASIPGASASAGSNGANVSISGASASVNSGGANVSVPDASASVSSGGDVNVSVPGVSVSVGPSGISGQIGGFGF
jgi:hypothetical protein